MKTSTGARHIFWHCGAPKACTKLIEFHFKLFHRRLATSNFLLKIKLKENENCTFCQNAPETLIHLFWPCQKTSKLWKSIGEWLQNMNIIQDNFALLNITALGLKPDTSNYALQINYCLLLARYHIWLAKTNESLPHVEIKIRAGDKRW